MSKNNYAVQFDVSKDNSKKLTKSAKFLHPSQILSDISVRREEDVEKQFFKNMNDGANIFIRKPGSSEPINIKKVLEDKALLQKENLNKQDQENLNKQDHPNELSFVVEYLTKDLGFHEKKAKLLLAYLTQDEFSDQGFISGDKFSNSTILVVDIDAKDNITLTFNSFEYPQELTDEDLFDKSSTDKDLSNKRSTDIQRLSTNNLSGGLIPGKELINIHYKTSLGNLKNAKIPQNSETKVIITANTEKGKEAIEGALKNKIIKSKNIKYNDAKNLIKATKAAYVNPDKSLEKYKKVWDEKFITWEYKIKIIENYVKQNLKNKSLKNYLCLI